MRPLPWELRDESHDFDPRFGYYLLAFTFT